MLADLAAPEKKFPPARDLDRLEDGLEDDIATISYEQALRAHARFKPQSLPQAPDAAAKNQAEVQAELFPLASRNPQVEASRKSGSVTVRMSSAECEQLRKRAAEAGITVSAYLRSCAFEVEALRAQVKDTLAQLRSRAERRVPWQFWKRQRRG
jgi:predicted DNA binding CopG/RHH family protein